jgi:hypothetical protein
MVLCKGARDQETRPGGGFVLRNASPMLLAGLTPEKREGTQNGFRLVARIVWSIFVGEGAKRVADIGLVTGIKVAPCPANCPFGGEDATRESLHAVCVPVHQPLRRIHRYRDSQGRITRPMVSRCLGR